jgi:hypothetical protein
MKKGEIIDRTGENYITNEGYTVEIIEYFGALDCTIQFDSGLILKNKNYKNIEKGSIKNPYHKSVLNIGFIGEGDYGSKTHFKIYTTWRNMLKRCYCEKEQLINPTYIECSVAEEWYNFQVFAEWFNRNYVADWYLDKDILIKGNKLYSPETCQFVPNEVNNLFKKVHNTDKKATGIFYRKDRNRYSVNYRGHHRLYKSFEEAFQAYKTAKEVYTKEVANKWQGKITEKTYQALINYQVEITD